ncbi:hypothetical protein [Avibacterium avium]|uniref:hypothetical protein n=1 Tax=Avibacterium avium TaxID=751 RepID=UPI003BF7BCB5
MSNDQKEELKIKLNEMIIQLQQAVKYVRNDDFAGASVFVGNVQNQITQTRWQLVRG